MARLGPAERGVAVQGNARDLPPTKGSTMTDQFAPADGVQGRGKTCAEHIRASEVGAQIPDHEIMDLLGCDRTAAFAAMREARKILEQNQENSIETRDGFGWVVIDRGAAMLREAKRQEAKTLRAAAVTARRTIAVDDDMLDLIERQQKQQLVQNTARYAEIKARRPRPLAEIARQAAEGRKAISEQRVRQLPDRRQREGA